MMTMIIFISMAMTRAWQYQGTPATKNETNGPRAVTVGGRYLYLYGMYYTLYFKHKYKYKYSYRHKFYKCNMYKLTL